ncbi:unnamed protein product [Rotaria magnacalcarata]|uniref:Uncharacterized protein n=2 Tax=Rotaria magnacalcarata TaxID=392030 RepID=A0A816RE01_9BILA|nr:unnamed protein product [Rotaria magnacalcarata]CAF1952964.1 unnamed protein product [Rotaria magnacalcarata]CAF2072480.1 unnamed protein product [Rotaria magnacalcarata]CAF2199942.1 unnamed protein product [Rotaria magnacalcarata]CAF3943608.1 unnamed protein product [Rotaria magnacalcarata]
MLKGLTWQTLRANYSLVPLFSVVTLGLAMGIGHSIRTLTFSTDVKVNRRKDERPWDDQLNSDGTFKHAKYIKLHDYNQLKKSTYEPELD